MSGHLMQTVPLWWYYISTLVPIILFAITLWQSTGKSQLIGKYSEALGIARERRDEWRNRAVTLKNDFAGLVTAVVPLIEKTDWVSGRYGRSIEILQGLESARNRHVDEARRWMMNSEAVASIPTDQRITPLPDHVEVAVTDLGPLSFKEAEPESDHYYEDFVLGDDAYKSPAPGGGSYSKTADYTS